MQKKGLFGLIKLRRFCLLLKHDIHSGIICKWKLYFVSALVFGFFFSAFLHHYEILSDVMNLGSGVGIIDFLASVFIGNNPIDLSSFMGVDISLVWVVFNSLLIILVGFYPKDELKKTSSLFVVRARSRRMWWTSKYVWCVISVVIYYLLLLLLAYIFTLFFGAKELQANSVLFGALYNIDISGISFGRLILSSIFLPMITCIAISEIQILISLFTNSVIGCISSLCFMIAASVYDAKVLIYNYTMICRTYLLSDKEVVFAFVGLSVLLLVTYLFGHFFINKKDIV